MAQTDLSHALVNADLHCHSSYSDGVLTPTQLAQRAQANGVALWSLTDHDELAGLVDAGKAAQALGLPFVPGVEISVTWASRTVHIVGLGIDPDNTALRDGLAKMRADRGARAIEMGQRLDAQLGVSGCYRGALTFAKNPALLSRTHFARHLVEQGRCASIQDVFDRYLGEGKPANVAGKWASLADTVAWIVAAGGRAVIAHPGRYGYSGVEYGAFFDEFKQLGGVGIEVVTGSHWPSQYREYANVARHYGFMASRGSDFHSPDESRVDLGALPPLPAELVPVWYDWL